MTLAHLRPHLHRKWGDREPIDVFNRLLAKHVRPAGWTPNTHMNIGPARIRSRKERWLIDRLGQLTRGHRGVAGPYTRLGGPIIVVEFEGTVRLLDGSHRINTWVAMNDSGVSRVNQLGRGASIMMAEDHAAPGACCS